MSLIEHVIDSKFYKDQCRALAERAEQNLKALDKLTSGENVTIQLVKAPPPTTEQLRAAWAEWWKEFFRLRDKYRRI